MTARETFAEAVSKARWEAAEVKKVKESAITAMTTTKNKPAFERAFATGAFWAETLT